ncbi:MAG: hypothetical protein IJI05_02080, partial [Erysipelotrichaceae bacterium]|nr:hypothetical protein [Erysipelotrichaceae bacterium]
YTYKNIFDEDYKETAESTEKFINDALTGAGITDVDNFLSNEDGSYTYINNPLYNYVLYSGRLFRALDINTEGAVKLVDMEIEGVGIVVPQETFSATSLYNWLNVAEDDEFSGIYEKSLDDHDLLLKDTPVCQDRVSTAGLTGCQYYTSVGKVGMLSFNDYSTMGGLEAYVNTGEDYRLQTCNDEGTYWFVNEQGAVSLGNHDTRFIGIRPVITLSIDTVITSGSGTKNDPFVVATKEMTAVKNLSVSNYVSYSNLVWRVVNIDTEGNAELLLNGYVPKPDGNPVTSSFGTNPVYNTSSGIGKYLNTTFLNTLTDYENVLVSHDWYYGPLNESDGYDYRSGYANTMNAYVGIPNTGCLFLHDFPNIYLSNTVPGSNEFTYVLDENYHLYQQLLTTGEVYMRPLIAMKGDIAISGGSGTAEDPFVIQTGGVTVE